MGGFSLFARPAGFPEAEEQKIIYFYSLNAVAMKMESIA